MAPFHSSVRSRQPLPNLSNHTPTDLQSAAIWSDAASSPPAKAVRPAAHAVAQLGTRLVIQPTLHRTGDGASDSSGVLAPQPLATCRGSAVAKGASPLGARQIDPDGGSSLSTVATSRSAAVAGPTRGRHHARRPMGRTAGVKPAALGRTS